MSVPWEYGHAVVLSALGLCSKKAERPGTLQARRAGCEAYLAVDINTPACGYAYPRLASDRSSAGWHTPVLAR